MSFLLTFSGLSCFGSLLVFSLPAHWCFRLSVSAAIQVSMLVVIRKTCLSEGPFGRLHLSSFRCFRCSQGLLKSATGSSLSTSKATKSVCASVCAVLKLSKTSCLPPFATSLGIIQHTTNLNSH